MLTLSYDGAVYSYFNCYLVNLWCKLIVTMHSACIVFFRYLIKALTGAEAVLIDVFYGSAQSFHFIIMVITFCYMRNASH
jgi:hypothetical protein